LLPEATGPEVSSVPVRVTGWTSNRRAVALPARPSSTLVVVHENANAGWHAEAGGRSLRSVTVDGWQQGFVVPAGGATTVRLGYAPDRTYRGALALGAAAVLALLALAVWPVAAKPEPQVSSSRPGRQQSTTALAVAVVVAALAFGAVAGAAAIAGLLAARRWGRGSVVLPYAAALAVMGTGAVLALAAWPGPGYRGAGNLVALSGALAVGVLVAGALDHIRTSERLRNAGSSIQR
jgi:arabinofuranan 3-O-arabinosyltransferase